MAEPVGTFPQIGKLAKAKAFADPQHLAHQVVTEAAPQRQRIVT